MKAGDQVKHSYSSLRGLRDYYLSCGKAIEKSMAKQQLDRAIAERGTVLEIAKGKHGIYAKVQWGNGSVSSTLPCQLEIINY